MGMDFAPVKGAIRFDADMRVTLVCPGNVRPGRRSYGVDFAFRTEVTDSWSVRVGDRVICTIEEDGTWLVTRCEPGRTGYHVRSRSKRGSSLQFRVNVTPDQARRIFGDEKALSYEFVAADNGGARAMFSPKSKGMTFVPKRGGA